MLDLVKGERPSARLRFLEPACGNFLVRILQRKLAAVELKFGKAGDFEKQHYAILWCDEPVPELSLLADNIAERGER